MVLTWLGFLLGALIVPSYAQQSSVSSLPATTLDGKHIDIAKQHGWRVVYFWSTVCPCVRACESISFTPLAKRYAGKVTFYGIVSDGFDLAKPVPTLRSDVATHHLPYAIVRDTTHATVQALGAEVTTQTYLIDPSNRVLFSGVPDDSRQFIKATVIPKATKTYLLQAIEEALSGKPITRSQVKGTGCVIAW